MLNIAICDDNEELLEVMKLYIENNSKQDGISICIRAYLDGSDLLYDINQGDIFDIIFLDIELNSENGINIAKKIREKFSSLIIIFVSAYSEYMYSMFDVNPFRYVKKPFVKEVFIKAFNEACNHFGLFNEVFKFSSNKKTYNILLKDIIYFEKNKRKINIYTKYGMYSYYAKLDNVIEQIKTSNIKFLKIRNGFVINVRYIKEYEFNKIKLFNDELIAISESMRKKVKDEYFVANCK